MKKLMRVMETVCDSVKAFAKRDWTIQEKILLVADCILFGIVLGAIWSPKREKSTTVGSFNSGNGCENTSTTEKK